MILIKIPSLFFPKNSISWLYNSSENQQEYLGNFWKRRSMGRNYTDIEKCVWYAMIWVKEKEKTYLYTHRMYNTYTHRCVCMCIWCVLACMCILLSSGNIKKKQKSLITSNWRYRHLSNAGLRWERVPSVSTFLQILMFESWNCIHVFWNR